MPNHILLGASDAQRLPVTRVDRDFEPVWHLDGHWNSSCVFRVLTRALGSFDKIIEALLHGSTLSLV